MNTEEIKVGLTYCGRTGQVVRRVIAMGDTARAGEQAFVEYAREMKCNRDVVSAYSFGRCSLAEFAAWAEREIIE